jgi:hypothetical protein
MPRLYSITEIARKLGEERRALKKATHVQPVAVAALGNFLAELYRLKDFLREAGK